MSLSGPSIPPYNNGGWLGVERSLTLPRCLWKGPQDTDCTNTSKYILIYGCSDQHLNEICVCATHLEFFVGIIEKQQFLCPTENCDRELLDYEPVPVTDLNNEYLQEWIDKCT